MSASDEAITSLPMVRQPSSDLSLKVTLAPQVITFGVLQKETHLLWIPTGPNA